MTADDPVVLDILPDCTGATYTCASEGGSAASRASRVTRTGEMRFIVPP